MFYKDNQNAPSDNLRAKSRQNANEGNNNNFQTMPESVQRILDEKKEQLDKAMKHYNMELVKLNQQKLQYEGQMKKLRIDQRELDLNRKKQKDALDKMKEEEMNKIKA